MSISISDYLDSISALTMTAQNASLKVNTDQSGSESPDRDSYIASGIDEDSILPSDNYNNILDVMRSAKSDQASLSSDSDSDSGTGTASATGSAGGSGGSGSDSEDEDETTTKIVNIGGITYLETTTVSNGITTVTRTALGA
jgi:hypothetical protein